MAHSNDGTRFHLFEIRGKHFLIDPEGPSLYRLSPQAYDLAQKDVNSVFKIPRFTYGNLKAYQELRRLFNNPPNSQAGEESELRRRLEDENSPFRGLWLGIAHQCNMACSYCFANEPSYLGRPKFMSWEVAKQAIDFLMTHAPETTSYHIIFFGGEPLLNLQVLKRVVSYCRELSVNGREFSFGVTTNGTLLDPDVYQYLADNDFGITLSIDGNKEKHNKHRRFKNDAPTWELICSHLEGISQFSERMAARVTIADADADLISMYRNLRTMGFEEIFFGEVSPCSGKSAPFTLSGRSLWEENYFALATYASEQADSVCELHVNPLRTHVRQLLDGVRSYYCCETGRGLYYVTPEGELYPCFSLLNDSRPFFLGTVFDGADEEVTRIFRRNHILNRTCGVCWARYLCGGQCHGYSWNYHRDLSKPIDEYCLMTKYKIEVAAFVLDLFDQRQSEITL